MGVRYKKNRAEYGKQIKAELSARLTSEFGKGFDSHELRRICQFYRCFPKWDTLRPELSWWGSQRKVS